MEKYSKLLSGFRRWCLHRHMRANLLRISRKATRLAVDSSLRFEDRQRLIAEIGQLNAATYRAVRRLEGTE